MSLQKQHYAAAAELKKESNGVVYEEEEEEDSAVKQKFSRYVELDENDPMFTPVLTDEDLAEDPPGHRSGYVAGGCNSAFGSASGCWLMMAAASALYQSSSIAQLPSCPNPLQ